MVAMAVGEGKNEFSTWHFQKIQWKTRCTPFTPPYCSAAVIGILCHSDDRSENDHRLRKKKSDCGIDGTGEVKVMMNEYQ